MLTLNVVLKYKMTQHIGPLKSATHYHGIATRSDSPMLTSYALLKHKMTQYVGPLKSVTHYHGITTLDDSPIDLVCFLSTSNPVSWHYSQSNHLIYNLVLQHHILTQAFNRQYHYVYTCACVQMCIIYTALS